MKKQYLIIALGLLFVCLLHVNAHAQTSPAALSELGPGNPWHENQLMDPAELAADIKAGQASMPLVFNIGAVEDIKGAKHIGAVNQAQNLEKLKSAVASLPKNTALVIYCGCCPFVKCPNIRQHF
jgi:hypothetical protein